MQKINYLGQMDISFSSEFTEGLSTETFLNAKHMNTEASFLVDSAITDAAVNNMLIVTMEVLTIRPREDNNGVSPKAEIHAMDSSSFGVWMGDQLPFVFFLPGDLNAGARVLLSDNEYVPHGTDMYYDVEAQNVDSAVPDAGNLSCNLNTIFGVLPN